MPVEPAYPDAELNDREKIQWIDQPVLVFFSAGSVAICLFAIPWTTFSIFWMCGASGVFDNAIRRIASFGRTDDTNNDGIPLGMPLLVLPKDAFLSECLRAALYPVAPFRYALRIRCPRFFAPIRTHIHQRSHDARSRRCAATLFRPNQSVDKFSFSIRVF